MQYSYVHFLWEMISVFHWSRIKRVIISDHSASTFIKTPNWHMPHTQIWLMMLCFAPASKQSAFNWYIFLENVTVSQKTLPTWFFNKLMWIQVCLFACLNLAKFVYFNQPSNLKFSNYVSVPIFCFLFSIFWLFFTHCTVASGQPGSYACNC